VDAGLAKRDANKGTLMCNVSFRPPPKSGTGWSNTEIIKERAWRTLYIKHNAVYSGYKSDGRNTLECWSYPKNETIDHISKHRNNYTITFKNLDRIKIFNTTQDPKQGPNPNLDRKFLRKVKDILKKTK
jgi:hypothetical protein